MAFTWYVGLSALIMALRSCFILVGEEEKDPKWIVAAKKAWETIRAKAKEKQIIK